MPPFQVFFLVDEPSLGFVEFSPPFPRLFFEFGLAGQVFFPGLDGRLSLDFFRLVPGPVQDALGFLAGFENLSCGIFSPEEEEKQDGE
jgi:hypothetical protein